MLYKEEFVAIGKLRKSHGYSGHARIDIIDEYYDDFVKSKFIFLEVDGYKVPFPIVEKTDHKHLIVKLEFLDDPQDILPYHQADIFLLEKGLTYKIADAPSKEHPLIGMTIKDKALGSIGIIERVEEYPQQVMAFINYKGEEIMIPLHESLIDKINEELGIIEMILPEGLLDL
ncbi:MAG: 16S rRNA processing protein RimM [Saprospiraceae bacterium]|jgi:16S rRNA processing protein RimM